METASQRGTLYHEILEKVNFENVNSVQDIKQFIDCNFTAEQISLLEDIKPESIYSNILKLKELITTSSQILKEQKFVMNVKYNEIADGNVTDKILVQGIIDLIIIKNNEVVLIDYKLTNNDKETIKTKYQKQLNLYALALSKRFKNIPIKKYILNLNRNEIIEM